jgi:hypothetical protein
VTSFNRHDGTRASPILGGHFPNQSEGGPLLHLSLHTHTHRPSLTSLCLRFISLCSLCLSLITFSLYNYTMHSLFPEKIVYGIAGSSSQTLQSTTKRGGGELHHTRVTKGSTHARPHRFHLLLALLSLHPPDHLPPRRLPVLPLGWHCCLAGFLRPLRFRR